MLTLKKSNLHGGKREGAGRKHQLQYIKKYAINPLKKGINKGSSYIEYLRKAAQTDNNYKYELDRQERREVYNIDKRYIV